MSDLNDPRVLLAAERTLLAWSRTSLALIAFGFLVERSGLLLKQIAPVSVHPASTTLTFWVGLAFILLGVFATAYSSHQYRSILKTLRPGEFPQGYWTGGGLVVNLVVALLGVALFLGLYLGST